MDNPVVGINGLKLIHESNLLIVVGLGALEGGYYRSYTFPARQVLWSAGLVRVMRGCSSVC